MHLIIEENNPILKSFIDVSLDHHFPIQNLPFGIFSPGNSSSPRAGVAIGDFILDLLVLENAGLFKDTFVEGKNLFCQPNLNSFMALGRAVCRETRARISYLLRHDVPVLQDDIVLRQKAFVAMKDAIMLLPMAAIGVTDFFSGKQHALNFAEIITKNKNMLPPNWLSLPSGWNCRASSLVISGTNVSRPCGQYKTPNQDAPQYGATKQLDTEVEVAFVIGKPSELGEPIRIEDAQNHIFGFLLYNDWSARDFQMWESTPLGPLT